MSGCPSKLVGSDEMNAWDAFCRYRDGFLPVAGGMLDQTAHFGDVVRLLVPIVARHEKRLMEPASG